MSSANNVPQSTVSDEHKSSTPPIPRWIPVSLLAVTTAALAVPVILIRRHRSTALTRALKDAAPPRRTSTVQASRASRSVSLAPSSHAFSSSSAGGSLSLDASESYEGSAGADDGFNGALYCAKAFGYATAIVLASALATVWGVRTYLGVKDTKEFADRMRLAVVTYMPVLSSRIHRPPQEEDGTIEQINGDIEAGVDAANWAWPDAERRLKAAFEKDGFSGWAEAAAKELEAEGKAERIKRGHV